jgi:hypothetical protein
MTEKLQIEEATEEDFYQAHQKEAEALDKKEKEEENDDSDSSSKLKSNISEYHMATSLNWLSITPNVEVAFRPLGLPYLSRTKPWHPKKIFTKKIITDSNQLAPVIFKQLVDGNGVEQNEIDESWIFVRFLNKISDKFWDNTLEPPKTAKKSYDGWWNHYHSKTEIFQRLDFNRPHESFMNPSAFANAKEQILIQAISRMDSVNYDTGFASFLTNNFTAKPKQIPKKNKKEGDKEDFINYTQYFVDYGISESLYTDLKNETFSKFGHWAIDVIIKKHKSKDKWVTSIETAVSDTLTRETQLRITPANKTFDIEVVNGREIKNLRVAPTPLSDTDKTINVYNTDELFRYTSYQDIFNLYAHTFLLADKELSTEFYDELVSLVKTETGKEPTDSPYKKSQIKKKYNLDRKSTTLNIEPIPTEPENPSESINSVLNENVAEAPSVTPPVQEDRSEEVSRKVSVEIITDPEQILANCKIVYPEFDKLPKPEQDSMVRDIESFTNGLPVFKAMKDLSCECNKTFIDVNGNKTDKQVKVHCEASMCGFCGADF